MNETLLAALLGALVGFVLCRIERSLKRKYKRAKERRKAALAGVAMSENKVMSQAEFEADKAHFMSLNADTRFEMNEHTEYPCLHDKYALNGGEFDPSYFVQDIWGARKVAKARPAVHYDVGSSVQGFIAHLFANSQKINLIDIRPMQNALDTAFLRGENGGGGGWLTLKLTPRI